MELPKAPKKPVEFVNHRVKRIDNYFWMNDREDPKVIQYLEDENAYTKSQLAHTEPFQKILFDEIVGRIKKTDMSVPYQLDGYWYYIRYENKQEYPIYCAKKDSLENEEIILINANERAKDHSYYNVKGLMFNPQHEVLAFGEDTVSRRIYTIRFKNPFTGETFSDVLENTTGSVAWANDGKTVFYTSKDDTLRAYKVFKHVLGTSQDEDVLVYHEEDERYACSVYNSKSKKYIMIASGSNNSDEFWYLDAEAPDEEFKVIQPREEELEYTVGHFQNQFYIHTNYQAINFRLMKVGIDNTSKQNWEEVIPHRESVLLEDFELFDKFLVLDEKENGLTRIRIVNQKTKEDYYLDFGEETYSAYLATNPEYSNTKLRYGYSSLTTPSSIFDFDMISKEKELLKQTEIIGGYNSEDYQSERVWATAEDGTKVPMSVVYKKGLQKNGNNPLLLYGYGSYGYTVDPYFSISRLSLLDRGFVFVIAHVRGGEYLGRHWYDDGKMLNKMNTFTDFISCGEKLIEAGFTNSEKLFAMGGSAGGLLMGAVINLRPELWKGIVAAVPFVDVVTTMLDDSIPLTVGEYDEWGNPNEKEYFDYMLKYSPYDNIEAKDYPNMLVTTGLHDSQVQYWEPAKWVAKLRELKTDDNKLLLHTNMEVGHGGASGRFESFKETVMEFAFLFDLIGVHI